MVAWTYSRRTAWNDTALSWRPSIASGDAESNSIRRVPTTVASPKDLVLSVNLA
jgi:hypothetical protein